MIEALKSSLGIITTACKQVGIDRTTHYRWLEQDPRYKQAVEEIPEITLDFAENALLRQIKENNTASTIFYLKTKGKHRGYIERSEIENTHKGEGFKLVIEAPDENNQVEAQ